MQLDHVKRAYTIFYHDGGSTIGSTDDAKEYIGGHRVAFFRPKGGS